MRAGKVVSIRLNPADCMSIIDLLEDAGFDLSRMGISNAASIAFSMLLEDKRGKGLLPKRLGFEYGKLMAKLDQNKNNSKTKRVISDGLYENAMRGVYPTMDGNSAGNAIGKTSGVRWVDDIFLPQEYDSWDDVKKWRWRMAQQGLLDAGERVMKTADGWVAPTA